MKHIFIIGCKGLPANYGGFETFTDCLVSKKKNDNIKYHVACMGNDYSEFEYNNARCFNVKLPKWMGPAKVIYYDKKAIQMTIQYIKANQIDEAIVYMLGCTAGPFINKYYNEFKKNNIKFFINPDGHEWKRAKWNYPIRKYLKYSEKVIIKNADVVVSDSIGIEEYVLHEYASFHPKTKFIAYGAEVNDDKYGVDMLDNLYEWYKKHGVVNHSYYLIVGRFVPENNYETMIREFMKTKTDKKLVIITNVSKNKFYEKLRKKTKFELDQRIKFVGTVYDEKLLYLIRKNAFGYIHGHEVGGTNPSLLESLAATNLNILLDVSFNTTVGRESAFYFSKENGSLSKVIDNIENNIDYEKLELLGIKAKEIIKDYYNWNFIINQYEQLFIGDKDD